MNRKSVPAVATIAAVIAVMGGWAFATQDKYTVKVTNGLAFSEFWGYESWQVVSISEDGGLMSATLANPVIIRAFLAGSC